MALSNAEAIHHYIIDMNMNGESGRMPFYDNMLEFRKRVKANEDDN
jgi:hypothetical protein